MARDVDLQHRRIGRSRLRVSNLNDPDTRRRAPGAERFRERPMTMTARTGTPRPAGGNGKVNIRVAGARGKRIPWVALGVILVVAGALIFGLMIQSAGHRSGVVVAARDINPGQV